MLLDVKQSDDVHVCHLSDTSLSVLSGDDDIALLQYYCPKKRS